MSRKVQIILVLLCVTGAASLVGYARFWPKAPPPLEEKYQGRFELFGYEPPEGVQGDNPLDRKQRWIYEFRADHIFRLRIFVDGGWELARRSGTVKSDGDDALILHMLSFNGELVEGAPERFFVRWDTDPKGEFLHLTQELSTGRGQQLFLRKLVD